MTQLSPRRVAVWAGCLAALWLAGCSSTHNRAPVEDRAAASGKPVGKPSVVRPAQPSTPAAAGSAVASGGDGAEVKGVTYLVKPGDTLLRIQGETGVSWRDLARWNNLDNPDRIETGMLLKLAPQPGSEPVATARPVTTARVDVKPLESKGPVSASSAPSAPSGEASAVVASASAVKGAASASATATVKEPETDIKWGWPASGPIVVSFDNAMSKGIDIAGKAGDAVTASAPGIVMFAGPYRGYGNMVILKHRDNFVSAYAHNRTILVKEDQEVRKGQPIAEMGATDSDRTKLHFEIRRLGNPLDPIKLLPGRQ